jgi:ATP-dependent exoDNAse (exonuclease V) beta subunit
MSDYRQLADQPARDRIRNDLGISLVVEAAAGTGKTTELVCRMISVIKTGLARLDELVAVTFTDAAAGELKLRLRTAIERERQSAASSDAEKKLLADALPQLEEARIGTIHSFCADLLRERPVEAEIDPMFEVAGEETARQLFDLAFDRWFEAQLQDPGEGVRRVLRRRAGDEGPRGLLENAAWNLALRRDFPAPWRRLESFQREKLIDALLEEMRDLGSWHNKGNPDDYFNRSLAEVHRFVREITRAEGPNGRDYDGIEARLSDFSRRWHSQWVGYRSRIEGFPKDELLERRDRLVNSLSEFIAASGADLAPRLRDELWSVIEEYERLKERAGSLDFMDLLLRARNLVRSDEVVRNDYQRRFTRLFVDEFQDTDPLQAEILMLLAADDPKETDWRKSRPVAGKLFVVGDPKQSIYRFRRADVTLYELVKEQICSAAGDRVQLDVSFRAVPEIQEAVNSAFAPLMSGPAEGEGLASQQARYVPLRPARTIETAQPTIVALPVPRPYSDYGKIAAYKIEESLPDITGAFVDWLVRESGWTVTEREDPDKRVAIQPRHVCLLFRRFRSFNKDVTRNYVRALEARNLPHLLVGGSSFHAREEVEAIRNALGAIERPDDELSLFATLRGPLFALSDSQLLAFRDRQRSLNPYKAPPEDLPDSLKEVADALAILRSLHRGRNHRPISDTVARLLAATRAHAGLAIWPEGEQALANVSRLVDVSRRIERNGITSFRGFVDWLSDQAERGEAGDAPIIEEGSGGVRLMTVHKAKGLEFPIVILADMTARDAREPSRWTDPERALCAMRIAGCSPPELLEHAPEEMLREREEAARVLYVAATRARDLLVVPAVGDQRQDGWLSALNPIIYPAPGNERKTVTRQAPFCPPFGGDSVVERAEGLMQPATSIVPGLHHPEQGEHRVVWWDPKVLQLDVQETSGLVQTRLLEADEKGARSEAGIQAQANWQMERAKTRESASQPTIRVTTATEHALAAARLEAEVDKAATASGVRSGSDKDVTVEAVGTDFSRPHGLRFGVLVHAVLSGVDLNADRAGVEAVTKLQGRIFGATEEEIAAAIDTAVKALGHPLLRRAAGAQAVGHCRREVPVSLVLEDGLLIEGVVDLAFFEPGTNGWTVVDFKTDLELRGRLDEYRIQVGMYARAVAAATGMRARAVLLKL